MFSSTNQPLTWPSPVRVDPALGRRDGLSRRTDRGVLSAILFTRHQKLSLPSVADALAIATPAGLFLGRVANFINAELWGRPSNAPWAVIFPGQAAQDCPGPNGLYIEGGQIFCARHPLAAL